jgi:DHA1 family inner membrane transport protein
MVMEKAAAAPSLASSANQAAFNLANAGGAWIGGLALAAGFGVTSPATAGAALAVLGVAVAGAAWAVDRRHAALAPAPGRERVVAAHVPEADRTASHAGVTE